MLNFFKSLRKEYKNITWPNKKAIIVYSILVVIISIAMALFIFSIDTVSKNQLLKFQNKIEKQEYVETK
jgi:preprotein translocase SecE subunit